MVSTRSIVPLASAFIGFAVRGVLSFDITRSDNLAVYWGQNSFGATNTDQTKWQQNLTHYCQDDTINIIPLAFLNVFFGAGGVPSIDLSNICSINTGVFNGTQLPDCGFMAADIKACQAKGKLVTLSLGGQTGAGAFTDEAAATAYADLLWNLFYGGTSDTRPFGDAVLDGVDLDVEGGDITHYATFLKQLQSHSSGSNKPFFTSAAPQCPFPDQVMSSLLNTAHFDAVFVQFYNNYCSVPNYANPQDWDYSLWDTWATTQSPNKDVKIFIGAPAAPSAANAGSYVDAATLGSIATASRSNSSSFGGIMLWDASQAYANDRFDSAVKQALTASSKVSNAVSSSSASSPSTSSSGGADCSSANRWVGNVKYDEKDAVAQAGHLWSAKWWSYGSVPGGTENDWNDEGACGAGLVSVESVGGPKYEEKSVPTVVPNSVPTSGAQGAKRSRVYRA